MNIFMYNARKRCTLFIYTGDLRKRVNIIKLRTLWKCYSIGYVWRQRFKKHKQIVMWFTRPAWTYPSLTTMYFIANTTTTNVLVCVYVCVCMHGFRIFPKRACKKKRKRSQRKQKRKTYQINTDVRRNHVLYITFRFPSENQSRFVYNTLDWPLPAIARRTH